MIPKGKPQPYQPSPPVQEKIDLFLDADRLFKEGWAAFEEKYAAELAQLEKLREQRNARLDAAKRELREEAYELDYKTMKCISSGPFTVQKKYSWFYIPERFVPMLSDLELYDRAIEEGVVQVQTVIDYEKACAWLEKNSLAEKFESAKDGKELTPAVSGPDPIPTLGAEAKIK